MMRQVDHPRVSGRGSRHGTVTVTELRQDLHALTQEANMCAINWVQGTVLGVLWATLCPELWLSGSPLQHTCVRSSLGYKGTAQVAHGGMCSDPACCAQDFRKKTRDLMFGLHLELDGYTGDRYGALAVGLDLLTIKLMVPAEEGVWDNIL